MTIKAATSLPFATISTVQLPDRGSFGKHKNLEVKTADQNQRAAILHGLVSRRIRRRRSLLACSATVPVVGAVEHDLSLILGMAASLATCGSVTALTVFYRAKRMRA
jgi:hypothetical protein